MSADRGVPPPAPRLPTRPADLALRGRVAGALRTRLDVITADAVAIFPSQGPQRLDTDYCLRLGGLVVGALAETIELGAIDYRSALIGDVTSATSERGLSADQLFTFVHLAERTAGDELALDSTFGATTEPWPVVSQLVRDAALHVLAAWTTRVVQTPSAAALTDALTTLHTRAVFEAALVKECHRAERFAHPCAVFLVDVDALGDLNQSHGYGVGDRVLERLGILLRTYFRQHDWVARYDEDAFGVLLPETSRADATALAERARRTIEERLAFRDYRTEQRVVVTVSVAVVTVEGVEGAPVDPARVLAAAEEASRRAKQQGRGTIEIVRLP